MGAAVLRPVAAVLLVDLREIFTCVEMTVSRILTFLFRLRTEKKLNFKLQHIKNIYRVCEENKELSEAWLGCFVIMPANILPNHF